MFSCLQVFDGEDNDVTPLPLHRADPAAVQVKASRFFLDEISAGSASDQTTVTGSFTMPFSRYQGSVFYCQTAGADLRWHEAVEPMC